MFLQASVILSTGGWVSASVHVGIPDTLQSRHPPKQTPLSRHPPGSRHPLGADTLWEQTPPGSRHPPEQTPPWEQTPPEWTPPRVDMPCEQTPLPGVDNPQRHTHTSLEQRPPPPTADNPPQKKQAPAYSQ